MWICCMDRDAPAMPIPSMFMNRQDAGLRRLDADLTFSHLQPHHRVCWYTCRALFHDAPGCIAEKAALRPSEPQLSSSGTVTRWTSSVRQKQAVMLKVTPAAWWLGAAGMSHAIWASTHVAQHVMNFPIRIRCICRVGVASSWRILQHLPGLTGCQTLEVASRCAFQLPSALSQALLAHLLTGAIC